MSFYQINAKAATDTAKASAEILIYGTIGESWWEETVSAQSFIKDLAAVNAEELTVRISSIGGSVSDGIAIYNALKRHPAKVTTINDAVAYSVASLILMAGDVVQMADNAVLMVHAPWTYADGNAVQLRKIADMLDVWSDAMAASYAQKTGKTIEAAQALLKDGEDHYFTAEQALAEGFIDDITEGLAVAASLREQSKDDAKAFYARLPGNPANNQETSNIQHETVAAATLNKEQNMPQSNTPAAADPTVDPQAIAREALAQDKTRRDGIQAAFKPFADREGVSQLMAQLCENTDMTVEKANAQLLAHLGSQSTPVNGSVVVTLEDETDKQRDAMASAILARAGVRGHKIDGANPYRGYKMLDLARASLENRRIKVAGKSQMEIVGLAFTQSTSDFPVLLENVLHKALQGAYATAPDTWSRFCKTGSVSDFREHSRYRTGSIGTLDVVNELGEYQNKTIPDGEKGTLKADTKGAIINLSRQAIINDDLDAFVGLADAFGRSAKSTIERDVYALLALNGGLGPVMNDGKTLFHADHGNLIASGGAPSVSTIEASRVLMASQLNIGGNDYLDIRPSIWLGPIGLGGAARTANNSEYDPDTNNKLQRANIVRGLFNDVVDTPRLSGTAWHLFADPASAAVLEVGFLDGQQEPYMEMEQGFDTDGARWKVRLDFGVGAVDYRGAVRNAGA